MGKKVFAIILALLGWFALIAQFTIMMENRQASVMETSIRFFSFFTVLTNLIVTIYFTSLIFSKEQQLSKVNQTEVLTAITIFITMVGLVYQIALRHLWQPKGLQLVVDELLHTIIPLLTIIFWYLYDSTQRVKYARILVWAIYPLVYLVYILVRGSASDYYPYPFVNVTKLGLTAVLINSGMLLLIFVTISALFLFIGKSVIKRT